MAWSGNIPLMSFQRPLTMHGKTLEMHPGVQDEFFHICAEMGIDTDCCNCCGFLGCLRAGGRHQKFGWAMGEIGDVLGPCQRQKPFPWASPCGTCATRVLVGTAALSGSTDQPEAPGSDSWRGRAGLGTALGLCWLCPEEMARGECRCHVHAERQRTKAAPGKFAR